MKSFVLVAAACVVAAFAFVQLAPADAGPQPAGKSQRAGGKRGPRGPRGPAGIVRITEVEGAELTLNPGEFGGSPLARCPSGSVVVGTGFNGPFNVVGGFVKAYGTFVGGFFANESSIPLTGNVQAICARLGKGASASAAADLDSYRRDVAEAEGIASGR